MLKNVAYYFTIFLIKHFLTEEKWLVSLDVKHKKVKDYFGPTKVKVVDLGACRPIGFVDKVDLTDMGLDKLEAHCEVFTENDFFFDTEELALNYVKSLKRKPRKRKIIVKGPGYSETKKEPVSFKEIKPVRKNNKKAKNKKK